MIRATLNKIIYSIKRTLFILGVNMSRPLSFLLKLIVRFILQRHEHVRWNKCPGLCTCPVLVATCPRQADKR